MTAVIASVVLLAALAGPPPASANLLDTGCGIIGTIGEGWMGKVCQGVTHPGKVLGVVKRVLGGGGGGGGHLLSPSRALGIAAIVAWAVGGAHFVLSETAKLVAQTTSPELTAAWFTSVYWRVTAVAALLTLPFLCAAAIQAMLRSDGALLARAVFGYLPLSFLATGVAAPLTMLLLGLSDWMGASVAQAAGGQGSQVLGVTGITLGTLGVAVGSPFVTFLIALLTAAGGLVLWLELLIREAAVYVVVLMLPLVFAAMVWPARRVWAIRSLEVLVALILSKFAIVSVLSLAAAALGHGGGSLIVKSLAGLVLVVLGAFAPWVLLRLLPLAEVAAAAAGHVRGNAQARVASDAALGRHGFAAVGESVSSLMARMHQLGAEANYADNGRPAHPTATRDESDATQADAIQTNDPADAGSRAERQSEPQSTGGPPGTAPTPTRPREGSAVRADAPQAEPEVHETPTRADGPAVVDHQLGQASSRPAQDTAAPPAETVEPAPLDEGIVPLPPPPDLDEGDSR